MELFNASDWEVVFPKKPIFFSKKNVAVLPALGSDTELYVFLYDLKNNEFHLTMTYKEMRGKLIMTRGNAFAYVREFLDREVIFLGKAHMGTFPYIDVQRVYGSPMIRNFDFIDERLLIIKDEGCPVLAYASDIDPEPLLVPRDTWTLLGFSHGYVAITDSEAVFMNWKGRVIEKKEIEAWRPYPDEIDKTENAFALVDGRDGKTIVEVYTFFLKKLWRYEADCEDRSPKVILLNEETAVVKVCDKIELIKNGKVINSAKINNETFISLSAFEANNEIVVLLSEKDEEKDEVVVKRLTFNR